MSGKLFVISGPSGAGKGTLVSRVEDAMDDIWVSVSATTRAPREGEVDGTNYFFMDREEFEKLASDGGFLEWAEYSGNLYGTPIAPIREHMAKGDNVILEIEVQGADQVKDKLPDSYTVFIEPPSMEVLEQRLRSRGTEADEAIALRMRTAEVEMMRKMEYDKQLVNDDLDTATEELIRYIKETAAIS